MSYFIKLKPIYGFATTPGPSLRRRGNEKLLKTCSNQQTLSEPSPQIPPSKGETLGHYSHPEFTLPQLNNHRIKTVHVHRLSELYGLVVCNIIAFGVFINQF